jgi:hypothetical protein
LWQDAPFAEASLETTEIGQIDVAVGVQVGALPIQDGMYAT